MIPVNLRRIGPRFGPAAPLLLLGVALVLGLLPHFMDRLLHLFARLSQRPGRPLGGFPGPGWYPLGDVDNFHAPLACCFLRHALVRLEGFHHGVEVAQLLARFGWLVLRVARLDVTALLGRSQLEKGRGGGDGIDIPGRRGRGWQVQSW